MTREQFERIIGEYILRMPSLPVTVSKILEICNNPSTSPVDLNKVISVDPVLMGKVMKLINSAYYSLSQEITSLVRAIIMLGINTVKNLALSTAVLGTIGRKDDFHALNMEGFWRHSLCVGVTAKLIAQKNAIDKKYAEEFFVAGLLHDIGKIPLNNRFSQDYVQAMAYADRQHSPLYLAEISVFGESHADVGRLILENWKLSEEVRDAAVFHHTPLQYAGPHKTFVYAVAAANAFAIGNEVGFSGDRYPDKIDPVVLSFLNTDWDWFDGVEEQVQKEIDKAKVFLKIAE